MFKGKFEFNVDLSMVISIISLVVSILAWVR